MPEQAHTATDTTPQPRPRPRRLSVQARESVRYVCERQLRRSKRRRREHLAELHEAEASAADVEWWTAFHEREIASWERRVRRWAA